MNELEIPNTLTMAVGARTRGGALRHLLHHTQGGGGDTAAMHLIRLLLRQKFRKNEEKNPTKLKHTHKKMFLPK